MTSYNHSAVEKKIARFLEKLPDKTWLLLTDTKDQVDHWLAFRKFNEQVSQCWKAMHQGKDDPLRPLLQKSEIPKDTYNHVWLTVDFYQKLWELIQLSFYYVQPELKRLGLSYQPSSAADLFSWILYNQANDEFDICLKPYYEVSSGNLSKATQLMSKVSSGVAKPSKLREFERLPMSRIESNVLLGIIIMVCEGKATKTRPALKARLEAFYVATRELNKFIVNVNRKLGSYAWVKGNKIKGSRYGGTYNNA